MRFTILNTYDHSVEAEGVIDNRVVKFSYPMTGSFGLYSSETDDAILSAFELLMSKDFSQCFRIKQLRNEKKIKVCNPDNLVIKCLMAMGCEREAKIIKEKHPKEFRRKLGTTISQVIKYNLTKIVDNQKHYQTVPVDKDATIPYYVLNSKGCYVMED